MKIINDKIKQKERGEVFTPTPLVNEMFDKLPADAFINPNKTFLDNACGNGQFLITVLERKMANGSSHKEALETIYGCEIDEGNVKACRDRLLLGAEDADLVRIVERNIICADSLDEKHDGWKEVGFYWENT